MRCYRIGNLLASTLFLTAASVAEPAQPPLNKFVSLIDVAGCTHAAGNKADNYSSLVMLLLGRMHKLIIYSYIYDRLAWKSCSVRIRSYSEFSFTSTSLAKVVSSQYCHAKQSFLSPLFACNLSTLMSPWLRQI